MLEKKIKTAIELIKEQVSEHSITMSSFGKDSMVLLDLISKAEQKLPILFFREPFFPEKYEFANKIILERGYSVYDYAPLRTAVIKKNGQVEIANFYQVGTEDEYMFLPTGITKPIEGKPFLCGLFDLLNKPTGTYNFPWDTVFIGHKSSDIDPMMGSVDLESDVVDTGPVKLVLPLKDFTDKDIWEYHQRFNLSIHESRYNRAASWKEFEDKSSNPDYFPACMLCIDKDEKNRVLCPKTGKMADNISHLADYVTIDRPKYIKR